MRSYSALIKESLVVLGLAGGSGVGHAQSDELADVPLLVSLQLGPGTNKSSEFKPRFTAKTINMEINWMKMDNKQTTNLFYYIFVFQRVRLHSNSGLKAVAEVFIQFLVTFTSQLSLSKQPPQS